MNSVDIFIYILIFAGLIAGFMTNCGYVMCLKYYSPLVVSNLILFEPIGGHILEATILGKSKIGNTFFKEC
jgi:drug/metabolite transporter (DMT)-like permease